MSFLDIGLLQPRDLVLHVLRVQLEVVRLGSEEVEVGGALEECLLVVAKLDVQVVKAVGGLKHNSIEVLWIRPWYQLLSQIWDLHGTWIQIWLFFLGELDPSWCWLLPLCRLF